MNNNENNNFMNIQPQDNNNGGSVPPVDPNAGMPQMEQPTNPVPDMNQNMGMPQMEQSTNPVPDMNQNMGMPQMEQPTNPVPDMNQNMGMPQMEQPANPVPDMNQNMGMPQMEQPANPVPDMNQNMGTVPPMGQPMNQMPNMNQNMGTVPPLGGGFNKKPSFMSKYGKFIFIGLIIIAIAAIAYLVFGGKKLTCTMSDSSLGIEISGTATFKFSGNTAKSVSMVMKMELPELYQDQMDALVEELESQYEEAREEGVDVKVTSTDSTITVTANAKNDQFSLIDMGNSSDNSYDAVKKAMEAEGFTCE